jgi:hypothetical protein
LLPTYSYSKITTSELRGQSAAVTWQKSYREQDLLAIDARGANTEPTSISEGVTVSLHGQELNPEPYAICNADMLIKGQEVEQIKLGNTLSDDQLARQTFDFMLSNPPFGVGLRIGEGEVGHPPAA